MRKKYLGIIVSSDLKVSKQCIKAANTANQILGMINRTIVCKNADIILPLFKSLVQPLIEYCIQAWRPWLQKDIAWKTLNIAFRPGGRGYRKTLLYRKGFKIELLK